MSDIDTVAVDSLKALDPNRPIREADIEYRTKSELDSPPHFFIYEEITKGKSSAYY